MPEGPILVTGSAGFVAPFAFPYLAEQFPGAEIVRTVRRAPVPPGGCAVDLADPARVDEMVRTVRPGIVLHLAAHSSVATASRSPASVWRDNRDASYWLARAIARHAPQATVLVASTAEVYGHNLKRGPADEDTPPCPSGPYANSKRAAEKVFTEILPESARLIIARPFNHTGPGQAETFVVASFAAQLARIEAGLCAPRMMVGNLDAARDFLDVRDVAESYARLLRAAPALPARAVVNVARGEAVTIRHILDQLLAMVHAQVTVEVDPARLRPHEIPVATATSASLGTIMPWPPARPLDETLRDVLADKRARVTDGLVRQRFSAPG